MFFSALRGLLVVGVLCVGGVSSANAQVLVSAASSLTDVLGGLARRFEQQTGERVVVNTGASNALSRQIAAGARVDVFISADERQMDLVQADIVAGTRVDLLSNRLAVAVARGGARLTSIDGLLGQDIRRIAIGDPAAVPAGVYARQYLETRGLWTRLQPRLVPVSSVRLALAAVEAGAADAAIVYQSDLATARRAIPALLVPADEGPVIRYPGAVMTTGANPTGGRKFLAFLQTVPARDAFRRAGFIPVVPEPGARR